MSLLNAMAFYIENINNELVDFNEKRLTFTLQLIKIWTVRWAVKNLKVILIVSEEDTDPL